MGSRKKITTDDSQLYISETDLKSLDLYNIKVELQVVILDKLKLAEQLLMIQQKQQVLDLKNKQKETVILLERAKQDYNTYRTKVNEKYDINLDDYLINDVGLLTYSPNK
jgi:DNA-binding protein H-NS